MEILAERLLKLRKGRKLSRKEVAQAVSIAEGTYQRYENAEREPEATVLVALADYFDVTTDYLLGRTDEEE